MNWNDKPEWTSPLKTNNGNQFEGGEGLKASDLNNINENLQYLYNRGTGEVTLDEVMYNLGAYDLAVANGDGTVTVTRKTGYLYLDGSDDETYEMWGTNGGFILNRRNTNFVGVDYYQQSHAVANVLILSRAAQDDSTQKCVSMAQMAEQTESGRFLFIKTMDSSLTTVDLFRSYLSNAPIYVQYETQTSYTEEVILDQPINTLDVNGEQFVRDEWEKGLNINSYSSSGSRDGFTWTYDENDQSLTFNGEQTESNQQIIFLISNLKSGYYTAIINVISGSFTTATENTTNCILRVGTNHGKSSYNSGRDFILTQLSSPGIYKLNFIIDTSDGQVANFIVMNARFGTTGNTLTNYKIQIALYEGDVYYPFYPYNGAIVHEKQLNDALEDYIPFVGVVTDINNISIGKYQKPFYGFVNSNTANAPSTSAGTLFTNNHSATYASQQYITDTGAFYFRDKQNGTWNAWKRVADRSWVQDNYLPLTGGTINGDLNVTGKVEENGERVYSPNNPPPTSSQLKMYAHKIRLTRTGTPAFSVYLQFVDLDNTDYTPNNSTDLRRLSIRLNELYCISDDYQNSYQDLTMIGTYWNYGDGVSGDILATKLHFLSTGNTPGDMEIIVYVRNSNGQPIEKKYTLSTFIIASSETLSL